MAKPKYTIPVRPGDTLELDIETQGSSGDGIAHHEGYTLFVPGALPGDHVRGRVTQVTPRFGVLVPGEWVERSPFRISPDCPAFPACGGCKFQDLNYDRQIEFKVQVLADALKHIGKLGGLPPIRPVPAGQIFEYRNKVLFAVQMRGGKLRIGFYRHNTHEVIDSDTCNVCFPAINEAKEWIRHLLEKHRVSIYNERKHKGFLRGLAIRHSRETGETLIGFVTTAGQFSTAFLKEFSSPEMQNRFGITGVVQNINRQTTNVVFGPGNHLLHGENRYREILGSLQFDLSLTSFFQVNPAQAVKLYDLAGEWASPVAGGAIDAYSGAGGIALWLARTGKKVVGIEEFPPAAQNAGHNANLNHLTSCSFLEGSVEHHLADLLQGSEWGTVILDPPRKGCSEEVLARLCESGPQQIVYISCNPSTLARDLARLERYQLRETVMVDMFPQTPHVESAVRLQRL
ncbi:MAG: 23S rRNA (uracil(1939)-C(5))-methyltransferase RlmD [Nitrospinae bacterium CG11_big_fil_rev_8_21_14_0_20_56_8]|nr:MAG: 23S rRNA (uracil(1939)-C(5))-methyltransferase RlmD [Nitrospinae bacterium CG11_big_fil_rev_8_21_14_0_20_56_8]